MLVAVCLEYATLPNPRTLTLTEIRFFYNGIRRSLKEHTKPKSGEQPKAPRMPRPRKR